MTAVRRPESSGVLVILGVMAIAVFVAVAAITYPGVDPWGTFLLPALLVTMTVPFIRRAERNKSLNLSSLLIAGLCIKFVGAFFAYLIQYEWYGYGDASRYISNGQLQVQRFWLGEIGLTDLLPISTGTEFLDELSGFVQVFVGQNPMANFMFFAWLSFFGLWAFVAGARRAVPQLDHRRYALLVLLLPSMLFWSSAVGKDSLMVLGLGLFFLGAAQVFTRLQWGFAAMAAGIAVVLVVRPHLALLAGASFAIAYAVRSRSQRGTIAFRSPLRTFLATVLLVAGLAWALSVASEILPGFRDGDAVRVLDATSQQSAIGGSEITVVRPNSPLEYPFAFFTVMFRPLPFEARTFTAALAAIEGTFLLVLFWMGRRRVVAGIRDAITEPYLLMASVYILGFAFAWSSVGNLGIIARQRVTVLPLLLIFIAIQATTSRVTPARSAIR